MTSWMKERDRLLEQTLAFVQGVAAQRPVKPVLAGLDAPSTDATSAPLGSTLATTDVIALPSPSDEVVRPAEIISGETVAQNTADSAGYEACESVMTLSGHDGPGDPIVLPPETVAITEATAPIRAVPPLPSPPTGKRPIELALPERDIIAQRVSRFRAGQQKLIRERDEKYEIVQAKIRAALGTDPSSEGKPASAAD